MTTQDWPRYALTRYERELRARQRRQDRVAKWIVATCVGVLVSLWMQGLI